MKPLLTLAAIPLFAACTQYAEPICNREAQEWNKVDTVQDVCAPSQPVAAVLAVVTSNDYSTRPVSAPQPPRSDPPTTSPQPERAKGNNGFGNGDQSAPGKSRDRNNAENSNRAQRNHGQGNRN